MTTDTASIYSFRLVYSGYWCQVVVSCSDKDVGRSEMLLSMSGRFEEKINTYINSYIDNERAQLENFQRYVKKVNSLRRKHASMYLEPNDMEETKEISLAMKLTPVIEPEAGYIVNYQKPSDPHPDIEIKLDNNDLIAVEITELVNYDCVKTQTAHQKYLDKVEQGLVDRSDEKERGLYLEYLDCLIDWNSETFNSRLNNCIDEKDDKYLKCLPDCSRYRETMLLIHTDEPRLSTENINQYLDDGVVFESRYFDSVYLVWYYPPKTNIKRIN